MNTTHPDIHALAGAYALHALPLDEERIFERHLAACDACQREVEELRATVAQLAHPVAEPAPASLRGRVLETIDVTRQDAPLLPVRREPPESRLRGVLASAAAAAVIVIIGLTAVAANLNQRIDQLEARSADILSVLAAEDARTLAMEGEGGARMQLTVAPDEDRALLVAQGLPSIGDDQVFELWLIDASGPQPAGLFRPDEAGSVVELLELDLSSADQLAVTVEPRGGSLQPTTEPFIAGEI